MTPDVQRQAEYRKIAEVLGSTVTAIDQVASALANLIDAEQSGSASIRTSSQGVDESARRSQSSSLIEGGFDRNKLRQIAVQQFAIRRLRQQHFARSMFGEPGWDIILALYICDWAGARFTSATLSEHVGAPSSSVVRWLAYLDREGLTIRDEHPTDRRKSLITLSDKGRAKLDQFLQDIGSVIS